MIHLLRPIHIISLIVGLIATTSLAYAQNSPGPQPVPLPPPIAAPEDKPYPGTIDLAVDITNIQRRVLSVHETIPVKEGKLVLLYPQWIPGNHSPTGPISKIAGLFIKADGKTITWVRDRVNVYAFHVDVPAGVKTLDVEFEYLAPESSREGRVSISAKLADLAWNTVVLYPAGYFARRIQFAPSLKLPEGWQFASALEVRSHEGNTVRFKDTSFNTLVDSPVYAGINFKRLDLSPSPDNHVFLNIVADSPTDLAMTPEKLQLHRNLAQQAAKLYNSHHYDHYDFLFLLSDVVGGIGLEHHQSSEDGARANYLTDWDAGVAGRDLLAHEYTHSWNGKFRRPADLWTPNFNTPKRDDLLWVYEGMTEYYGFVLTARAGLRTPEQTRDLIALIAANFDASLGRTWRPLIDTTNQPIISQRAPVSWVTWQRPEDYYTEGLLIWLDADTKIRELSGGKKSLDDFAKLFLGIDNGSYITKTYKFEDLVAALNKVQPYDWNQFLRSRVYELAPQTPEAGITQGGYKLTYSDKIPEWLKQEKRPNLAVSFSTSLGFSVRANGEIGTVWWDSVAFKAGITPDMQLMAVNGQTFKVEELRKAIIEAEKGKAPIKLLMKRGDTFQTFELDYHGGLRVPKLERVDGTPDRLGEILTAVK